VHPLLFAKAISALYPQEINLEDFQAKSGIVSKTIAKDVLEYIANNGIGVSTSSRNHYLFSKADRMKLAILALQKGCDIGSISKSISWKDFEALTSEILSLHGYRTETNIRLSKPSRIEIDVIGTNHKLAIVADCKHWRRYNLSSISSYAEKQIRRTKILYRARRRIKQGNIAHAIPIILTLYSMDVEFINGVPIVPINKFQSFIEDVSLHLSEIRVIHANRTTRTKKQGHLKL
jgi:hypothetical protein